MSPPRRPAIEPLGEGALLVILGERIERSANARSANARSANARVHAIAAAVRAEAASGVPWGRPVPTYESVLVPFDPDALDADVARSRLAELVARVSEPARATADILPVFEIPTRYGGPDGPDLDEVAHRLGRSPAEVVALHAGRIYVVFMLGFSPGFAYLGALPQALEVPRRDVPRTRVPAGSVAIAARQTGVYPTASPGGWNLIGRTDATLWDPLRDPPTPLGPGRRVRFVPVAG